VPDRHVLFVRTDACTLDPRVRKEAETLTAAGYSVDVFGWDRRGEFPRRELIAGVQYSRSRIPAPYGSRTLALMMPLFWIRGVVEILRIRPEVIHACDFDALVPALAARIVVRSKIVYDIFDTYAQKIGGVPAAVRRWLDRVDRLLMRHADVVLVADAERARQLEGVKVRALEVIMNVPPDMGEPAILPATQTLRLCYAGSIHEQRGLYLIAESTMGLEGVETTFAGWIPRAVDREFLRRQSHLRFLGRLEYHDSLELIRQSNVVLALYDPAWPINVMASSNKVFEAMAAGRPVITNEETTMARIVREEDCGCLVPYGDPRALQKAIRALQVDPGLRDRLGANGFLAFRKKYNWGIMNVRLLELYGRLIAQ